MSVYPPVILASASERRHMLLRQARIPIAETFHPHIDETPMPKELPRQAAQRLALSKLQAAMEVYPQSRHPILAADTLVAKGRRILGKAENRAQAERYLKLLSGSRHKVITAIALHSAHGIIRQKQVISTVRFKRLDNSELNTYLQSDEWHNKAGAYAIQGQAAAFVNFIGGSYSNVVGLPLFELCQILRTIAAPQNQ